MLSYWDLLPIEIHQLIYDIRDEILRKERIRLINGLTDDELSMELYRRRNKNSYRGLTYIIYNKIIDLNTVYNAMELGINMNYDHIDNGESQHIYMLYKRLTPFDRMEISKEIIKTIPIEIFCDLMNSEDEFINLGDWIYMYLKGKLINQLMLH